jgi:hypothetical protein
MHLLELSFLQHVLYSDYIRFEELAQPTAFENDRIYDKKAKLSKKKGSMSDDNRKKRPPVY